MNRIKSSSFPSQSSNRNSHGTSYRRYTIRAINHTIAMSNSNQVSQVQENESEYYDYEKEMKADDWYYGKIPEECTYENLIVLMAQGLIKFRKDYHKDEDVKYSEIASIMDLWFEHDAYTDNKFDHLVPEEDFESFEVDVLETIKSLEK